jgi:hypothetical protein
MVKTPRDKDRKRKSAPKTKTGCLTCKYVHFQNALASMALRLPFEVAPTNHCLKCRIRRVKCGEEKPACQRCLKFGVKCDGYLPLLEDLKSTASNRDILPRTNRHSHYSSNILVPISVTPVGSEKEYRYFDLFCAQTSFEIMPAHDSFSVRHMLLQASHFHSSLKHGIIALGALDKTAGMTLNFNKLSLDNVADSTRANEHHQFALEEYIKAVADMRKGNTLKDVRVTLLSILLIFCFEAWNGNMEMAVRQIQNGVRIIREWKSTYPDADKIADGRSPAPHIVEHDLIMIFERLVIQVSYFGHRLSEDIVRSSLNQSRESLDGMPRFFTTIRESVTYHQKIYKRASLLFSAFVAAPPPSGSHIAHKLRSEQNWLTEKASHWLKAFEPVYSAFEFGYSICEGRLVRMSKSQIMILYIILSAFFSDQTAFDDYYDMFAEIARVTEEASAMIPVIGKSNPTNYSLAGRAVSTLWITGVKCRDRAIRRKAHELLVKYPRREGIWDSLFCARMIEFVIELEEEHLEGDYVPGWARIDTLRWDSDFEKRTAALMCEQRVSSSSDEVVMKTKTITW